ncbi:MAG: hypothetical protein HKN00_08205 [Flavobacteriaceae bacterium]|nr:hypothetical protein [Bacteroidia bacterium]MBT8286623.1 hypothetical protein [Bacteroidia bacterium]NNF75148.1 hypothetical protein [Flavobacteriaceae bacterium]NNK72164.1 hypothetical protein [Flavobacteriaceae bacterium]
MRTSFLLVLLTLGFVTLLHAQPKNYMIKNNFMLGGGITYFDMISDNFETKKGNGWLISTGIGAYLPHKWYDISYNIQLMQNKFEVSGRVSDDVTGNEMVEYKMFAAQAGLVFHINIIGANLSLDLGPQLHYNGELEITDGVKENYFINGYESLMASEITDINKFNINGMAGVTAGFGRFKVRAQYIYGLLNSLDKLNKKAIEGAGEFKGNPIMFTAAAFISF